MNLWICSKDSKNIINFCLFNNSKIFLCYTHIKTKNNMEIKELISYYINETSKTLDVTFRLITDLDDEVRTDQIQLSEVGTFGYNFDDFIENTLIEMYDEDDENELFGDFFDDYSDNEFENDEIRSFLNEYYLIYPEKLPNPDFF
jgi:hypothetical protein